MKNFYNILSIAFLVCLSTQFAFSQEDENKWSFQIGLSAVDLFPVGEDMPQGEYFDEFFNLNDHWNLGVYAGVTRHFTENFSLTAKGTINNISKWGEFGEVDESVLVDNLKYYGLDGMLNYSFGQGKLQPFIAVGGGYTWIEEGRFNTFSARNGLENLVGAGTVNGSVGFNYWINNKIGVNLQTTYKHTFKEYLPKHWDHNLGLIYKLGTTDEVVEEVITDRDADGVPDKFDVCPDTFGLVNLGGCPDTDGDGVIDKDDLCPRVKGSMAFGGCVDTDGDGVPDSRDKCPDVKGMDGNGCALKVVETTKTPTTTIPTTTVTPFIGKIVYFDYDSSKLDENAKVILDHIVENVGYNSGYNVSIQGHADNRGNNNYNYNLSLARAQAVKRYLASKNINNSSINISAKGENEPSAPNTTDRGRALNRRAELTINVSAK